jgi:hypothetical protein
MLLNLCRASGKLSDTAFSELSVASSLSCHCVVYRQHLIDVGVYPDFKRVSAKAYIGAARTGNWVAH